MDHPQIVPSLLAFNIDNWKKYFHIFKSHNINYIHFDVMDYAYVNNIAYTITDYHYYLAINPGLKSHVHLMVCDPLNEIRNYNNPSTDAICFHFDVYDDANKVIECLKLIKSMNIKPGIAINPNFQISDYCQYLDYCEFVTVMGVYPGKGGQKFEPSCLNNLHSIQEYCHNSGRTILVEIDGGMNFDTIPFVLNGANYIVSGSFLANNITEISHVLSWLDEQRANK